MKKLYLIVRSDLTRAQQAVQAAHALQEFNVDHPSITREWFETSNHLAMLSVANEEDLHKLAEAAGGLGLKFSLFREPDRNNELTALAFEPSAKKLLRHLPLALAAA